MLCFFQVWRNSRLDRVLLLSVELMLASSTGTNMKLIALVSKCYLLLAEWRQAKRLLRSVTLKTPMYCDNVLALLCIEIPDLSRHA
jgi:hypothetical protein